MLTEGGFGGGALAQADSKKQVRGTAEREKSPVAGRIY
jgi:hypothetical protein